MGTATAALHHHRTADRALRRPTDVRPQIRRHIALRTINHKLVSNPLTARVMKIVMTSALKHKSTEIAAP